MRKRERLWSAWLGLGLLVLPTFAISCALSQVHARAVDNDSTSASAREKFFEQNVRPLLAEKCYSCHGDKKQKSGLRLDSIEAILKGGESGPAVVPGKPNESLLVSAINYTGPEMPPDGKLAPDKVAILTSWIASGAAWPRRDRSGHATDKSTATAPDRLKATDQALWSLQPVRDSKPPEVSRPRDAIWSCWPRNPIDRFVLKALQEKGLVPATEASRVSLIRRVTFDLTGLPPTKAEVGSFVNDQVA